MWLGRTRKVRAPGLFALYVAGYSGFRMFEETLRIDYSNHFLGLRLNFYVAAILCIAGLASVRGDPARLAAPSSPGPPRGRAARAGVDRRLGGWVRIE